MKRDWDLIRLLLLKLEGQEEIDLSNYCEEAVGFHNYLIWDRGLAKGADMSGGPGPSSAILWELTWEGYDFLGAARSTPVWDKVKARLADVGGSAGFEVVKALLIATAKDQLGL